MGDELVLEAVQDSGDHGLLKQSVPISSVAIRHVTHEYQYWICMLVCTEGRRPDGSITAAVFFSHVCLSSECDSLLKADGCPFHESITIAKIEQSLACFVSP